MVRTTADVNVFGQSQIVGLTDLDRILVLVVFSASMSLSGVESVSSPIIGGDFGYIRQGRTLEGRVNRVADVERQAFTLSQFGYGEGVVTVVRDISRIEASERQARFRTVGYNYISGIKAAFIGDRDVVGYRGALRVGTGGGQLFGQRQIVVLTDGYVDVVLIILFRYVVVRRGVRVVTIITRDLGYVVQGRALEGCVDRVGYRDVLRSTPAPVRRS